MHLSVHVKANDIFTFQSNAIPTMLLLKQVWEQAKWRSARADWTLKYDHLLLRNL